MRREIIHVLDAHAAVNVFEDSSKPIYAADVGGSLNDACEPDGRVDWIDILALVDAFQGLHFEDWFLIFVCAYPVDRNSGHCIGRITSLIRR